MIKLPDIRRVEVSGKTVFLRADLDIPLSNGKIVDDARLMAGLPTITYLLEHGAKLIIAGHLDRPKGVDRNLSLEPVAEWFSQYHFNDIYHYSGITIEGFSGWKVTDRLFLLENLRFYPGEEENDPEFAKKLAALVDIYVNDAFAICHHAHASVVGVAKLLPHFAGLHLQQEIESLSNVLKNPSRPLVVIIGGKKIETKRPLVSKMISFADKVLVGGLVAQSLKEKAPNLIIASSNSDGIDVSDESVKQFIDVMKTAKTIVWNGPVGKISNLPPEARFAARRARLAKGGKSQISNQDSDWGTKQLAEAITKSSAYRVVGGGDTTEFLKRIGLLEKFDFVSTGGGAMLSFLSGEKLPGLEALLR